MSNATPLRSIEIAETPMTPNDMAAELEEYVHVLLGRVDPPLNEGVMTLMEVASAYYARAMEMSMAIHRAERMNRVKRGDPLYRFRTGELRDFLDLAKNACELGSRRVTAAQLEQSETG